MVRLNLAVASSAAAERIAEALDVAAAEAERQRVRCVGFYP